jgi:hypothetical protein
MQGGSDVLPYVAVAVVVVGWFVANRQANAREDRKEARALVDGAKARALLIADDSIKYLCEGKTELALPIKASIEVLEVELARMPYFSSTSSPLLRRLVAFQDAVTGGDFETAAPAIRAPRSPEVAAVLSSRINLLAELERQFRVHYLGGGSST